MSGRGKRTKGSRTAETESGVDLVSVTIHAPRRGGAPGLGPDPDLAAQGSTAPPIGLTGTVPRFVEADEPGARTGGADASIAESRDITFKTALRSRKRMQKRQEKTNGRSEEPHLQFLSDSLYIFLRPV